MTRDSMRAPGAAGSPTRSLRRPALACMAALAVGAVSVLVGPAAASPARAPRGTSSGGAVAAPAAGIRSDSGPQPHGNGLIAFTSERTGNQEIFVMNPDGSGQANLTNDSASDDYAAAWSPDGTEIAWTKKKSGDKDVWVMNADGTGKIDLTNNPTATDTQPSWSPDGTQIAFASKRAGNYDVWIMGADGSNPTQFTDNSASETKPAWSPDGTKILFTTDRTGDNEIYVKDVTGTTSTDLTNQSGSSEDDAAWSPDGSQIAFTTDRKGENDVYVMNADGTAQTDLTGSLSGSNSDPAFSPDAGARVVYIGGAKSHQVKLLNVTPAKTVFGNPANESHDSSVTSWPSWQPLAAKPANGSPIQHVVILFQENHSFDNVLGVLCVQDSRCDGATKGKLHDGSSITLGKAADLIPNVDHSPEAQTKAVDGGKMDGFDLLTGCSSGDGYACYTQFQPDQVPNVASLARSFALSDRTFENDLVASWVSHLQVMTAFSDGFKGNNPVTDPGAPLGWGCNANADAKWRGSSLDAYTTMPSCIPKVDGTGPYEATSAGWMSSILGRLDQAGLTYHLDVPDITMKGYTRAICPSFADCIYGNQGSNVYLPGQIKTDAAAGALPSFSIVSPSGPNSQHNDWSMLQGDGWIAEVVNALVAGPQWSSTAVFITWDDCGCFYDHVPPPTGLGIRVPMLIVSPYAKAGYTDSMNASYASMLAYVEHTFGLAPMSSDDATAYDFSNSFDYSQRPLAPIELHPRPVPAWELAWMARHPADESDPT